MSGAIVCAMVLHLAAWHAEPGYRTETPGTGIVCEQGRALAAAGAFQNSEGGESRYAVVGLYAGAWGPLKAGAVVGVIDGYSYRDGKPFPVAAGLVTVDVGAGWGLRFLAVPPVRGVSPLAVQAAVSRGF